MKYRAYYTTETEYESEIFEAKDIDEANEIAFLSAKELTFHESYNEVSTSNIVEVKDENQA